MSTSSGSGRDGKKKNPLTVSVDFRDINGQMREETDYIDQNLTRQPNSNSVVCYSGEGTGTQIGKWSGNNEAGHTFNGGLISSNYEASIYETNTTVGGYNAGVTTESGQFGVEANVEGFSQSHRIGPVKLNASALGGGYEIAAGRKNTGAFIRGNLASVSGAVGPVGGTLSAGFDTGVRAGEDGFEAKVLGTGLSLGNEGVEVSLFGMAIKFKPR